MSETNLRGRAAAVISMAALALLAAACSSSSSAGSGRSPNAGGSANSPSTVSYSHCMRSQGLPNFPDPDSSGALPKTSAQELGVSSSRFAAAQRACQHLLPTTGTFQQRGQQCIVANDCSPAMVQQILTAELKLARCMRAHGVPNWPDPTIMPDGRPGFVISISGDGFDPRSPQISANNDECQRLTNSPEARQVSP